MKIIATFIFPCASNGTGFSFVRHFMHRSRPEERRAKLFPASIMLTDSKKKKTRRLHCALGLIPPDGWCVSGALMSLSAQKAILIGAPK